jgi:Protein of unknwon function (DUF3310)
MGNHYDPSDENHDADYYKEYYNKPKSRPESVINYKYDEENLLAEIKKYIDTTYQSHYSSKSGEKEVQALELIIGAGLGHGFLTGDVIKYAARYGKKDGYNRKDVLKIIHYGILLLYWHDLTQ